jgi:hypothetical protein
MASVGAHSRPLTARLKPAMTPPGSISFTVTTKALWAGSINEYSRVLLSASAAAGAGDLRVTLAGLVQKGRVACGAENGPAPVCAPAKLFAISDCAHIGVMQANECLRLAGRQNKLDLKTIGRVQVNDGPEITATQALLGQVPIQDDSVKQVEHDYPGCAVMK